jgi:hypothetical protein
VGSAHDDLHVGDEHRDTVFMLHGSTEETGCSDRAESVALACELRENNNTLTTIRFKHGEVRL